MGFPSKKFVVLLYLAMPFIVGLLNADRHLIPDSIIFGIGKGISYTGFTIAFSGLIALITCVTKWGRKNRGMIFRRVSLAIIPLMLAYALTEGSIAQAEFDDHKIRTFQGIDSLFVAVEDITGDCQQLANAEDSLKTLIELKLRQNGIKVVSREVFNKNWETPAIYLNVNARDARETTSCFGNISLELHDAVRLYRDGEFITFVETWKNSGVFLSPFNSVREYVKSIVDGHMDKFLNAYFQANPRE